MAPLWVARDEQLYYSKRCKSGEIWAAKTINQLKLYERQEIQHDCGCTPI